MYCVFQVSQGASIDDSRQVCGQFGMGDGETVSSVLYLFFYADNKVQGPGFNISYHHVKGTYNFYMRIQLCTLSFVF